MAMTNDRSFLYPTRLLFVLLCLVPSVVQAKGGSYGGGGGRGGSGGGSYSGSYTIGAFGHSMRIHGRGGNCDEGECNSFGEIAFLAIVGQLLIFGMFGLCIGCLKLNWRRKINEAKKQALEELESNIDTEQGYGLSASRSIGTVIPETVTFLASYVGSSHEGGYQEIQSSGTLVFSSPQSIGDQNSNHNMGVRSISGNGSDKDGVFSVLEGALAPSGKCYWVEEEPTYKRQSLVQGSFVPCHNASGGHLVFQGGWEATNGARGRFLSFELTPKVYLDVITTNNQKIGVVSQLEPLDTPLSANECYPVQKGETAPSTTSSPLEIV